MWRIRIMARLGAKDRGLFERPKSSGVWWVRYIDGEGREHRERVGPKGLARQVYEKRKTEIREGRFFPREQQRLVLCSEVLKDYDTYCDRRKRWVMSSGARGIARKRMKDAFGDVPVNKLKQTEVEGFILGLTELKEPLKPSTANRYLTVIRAAFNYAIKQGKAKTNPTVGVKKFKENNERVRYLTDKEEDRLFKALPLEHHNLVLTDLHTGLRQGELFKLRWTDIDFYSGTINIRQSKSGEGRRIPMNTILRKALRALRQARHRQGQKAKNGHELYSPFVFCSPNGAYLRNFARIWYPTLEEAKVEDFHFHDFRHTFATRLVMAGVDLYTVKTLLGHKTIQMTMRYAHLAPGHLKQAVEVLARKPLAATRETETSVVRQ
jgi:integrase